MKTTKFILSVFVCALAFSLYGQNIEITFAGDNNGEDVTLDSIYIKNLTQDADIMLYAPVNSINLLIVGLNDLSASEHSSFSLSQNFPNPFKDKTELNLYMDKGGLLNVEVFSLLGKRLAQFQRDVTKGSHHFSFLSGGETVYLLSATAFGITQNVKMFSTNETNKNCQLNYLGNSFSNAHAKSSEGNKDLPFALGDDLLFVGYEVGESGILDSPEGSTTHTFQFATNIPCIGVPTVDYEGQVYNTIQIYSQCWFKENLNVGEMISSSQAQLDNDVIEKYCLVDDPNQCHNYGGVYMWEELMQYTLDESPQGICPPGWHVPSDEDWKVLEGAVDSQYGIGNAIWNTTFERGSNVGYNLKSTSGWYSGGNGSDAFGFTAISGGYYYNGGGWAGGTLFGPFYTSSYKVVGNINKPYHRGISWVWSQVSREYDLKEHARPIRCLKD